MILVISHETAWKAACKKYNINGLDVPEKWPALLTFETGTVGLTPDNLVEVATNVGVISVEQAAKFLSICPAVRLAGLDVGTRSKIVEGIAMPKASMPGPQVGGLTATSPIKPSKVYSATDAAGDVYTFSGFPPSVSFKVGDKIQINGNVHTIVAAASSIVAPDPITGAEGMVEFKDDEAEAPQPEDKIPGLEEIPMDPGKLITKDKIAQLGDKEEHVLDDERDV
jgi:hypothetical protein